MPISLCQKSGQLYHVLRNYKSNWGTVRQKLQVAATIGRFLTHHADCLAAAADCSWDDVTLTSVPSSRGREGTHPLELSIAAVTELKPRYRSLLVPGPQPMDHGRAHDDGYRTSVDVHGLKVLLVDDTFTTGARVHSAASALQLAGADVVAAVVVVRLIDPDFNAESKKLWDEAGAKPFDFGVCCLCCGMT